MNNNSIKFFNTIVKDLDSYINFDLDGLISNQEANESLTQIVNIFELLKENRIDDLMAYINDSIAYTENKNYSYKVRDKLSFQIKNNLEYIREIESNE